MEAAGSGEDAGQTDVDQEVVLVLVQQANQEKDEGNERFRTQEYAAAIDHYSAAIDLLREHYPPLPRRPIPPPPRSEAKPKPKPQPKPSSSSEPKIQELPDDYEEPEPEPEPKVEDPAAPPPEQLSPAIKELCEAYATCHANRAACHLKVQDYEAAEKDCTVALERRPDYGKVLMRRAEACDHLATAAIAKGEHVEASSKLQTAVDDLRKALEVDPAFERQARPMLRRLEPILAVEQEKMKDEMIGKLKDMGNWLLGKVGLSLDNFQTTKDPATGNISIQFTQNPAK